MIDEEFVASKPRTNRKQTHRPNHKADIPLNYYQVILTIPFIDHLIAEHDPRFNNSSMTAGKGFAFMPSVLILKIKSDGRASWNNEFLDFAESYKDDFPDFINLKSEMDTWETYWTKHYVGVRCSRRAPAVTKILETISFAFPNMMTALRILPVNVSALFLHYESLKVT